MSQAMKYLGIFIIISIFAQLLVQMAFTPPPMQCGIEAVPASHLKHPLLKLASQVKASTHVVTLIFEDMGSIEFLQNTVMEVQKVGIHDYLVIALNASTCDQLQDEKCYYKPYSFQNSTSTTSTSTASSTSSTSTNETGKMSLEMERALVKSHTWLELLQNNYSIFSISSNVFLRDNPLMYFDRTVDINAMREFPAGIGSPLWATLQSKYHMCCLGTERYLHPAFIFLAATNCSIHLVEDMIELETLNGTSEIDALNIALYQRKHECTVRALQKDMFPNGFVGFLMAEPQRLGFAPVALLSNWESNTTGMIYRAREMLSWDLDPPSRFNTTNRMFISYSTSNDYVTFHHERDFLSVIFMLGKLLNREVILPLFHCYIGEPASCLFDVVFDPVVALPLGYLENSFLHSADPPLSAACVISLSVQQEKAIDYGEDILLADLATFFNKTKCQFLKLEFPVAGKDGFHIAPKVFPDRHSNPEWETLFVQIEETLVFNTHALFSKWYLWWLRDLQKENYTCVITDGYKTQSIISLAKELNEGYEGNKIYLLSTDPSRPAPIHLHEINKMWGHVVHGYESTWIGHQLMVGHSILVHLQMEACAKAQYVIVNTYGPKWLVDGIMYLRDAEDSISTFT